jgi:hypothetical protein
VISFHYSRILSTPSNHPKHCACNETIKNMPKILWTRLYFMMSVFLGCPKTCLKHDPWRDLILYYLVKFMIVLPKKIVL